ncbi:MAG: outer membrane protein assembly factor BamA [Gemmatimonadetes bacterium]|nr:outer membrane protein assembly factor BamA [Gemmatimonadota bacterium]
MNRVSHFFRGGAAAAALLTLALCALAPAAAHAQDPAPAEQAPPQGFVVDTVVVRGTQRVTDEAVRVSSGVRAGSVVNAPLVQEAIRRLMATGNFESVQVFVRGAEQGRGALVLAVVERPLIAEVRFEGLRSVSGATVRDSVRLREGQPLDPQKVAAARKLTRDLLAARGIQLVSIDTSFTAVPAGGLRLTFRVVEGNRLSLADVDFTGNTAFSDEALQGAMQTKEEGFWWFRSGRFDRQAFEEDLRSRLPAFYGRHGYIDFAVVRDTLVVDPQSGKARLLVEVQEGPQYRLGEFNVQGNSRFPSEALASMFTTQRRSVLGLPFVGGNREREAGEVFDQPALNKAAAAIEQQYRNEGYLFAQVIPTVERVPAADGGAPRVNVTLAVSEQQPFYIRSVSFRGNTTTHENVIRERLWIVPGDVYNEQRVIQSYQAIAGLGFFEVPMPTPDITPDPQTGQVDIVFNIKEKQTGSVNFGTVFGGGGYGDRRSRFAGFLQYSQPNLFGQGKQVNLRAEYGYGRSTLEAGYTDPAIGGGRNSGSASVFRTGDRFFQGDVRRLRTGVALQFGFPIPGTLRTRAFLGYSLAQTQYLSTAGDDDARCGTGAVNDIACLPDATGSTLSFSLARDTKNHPLFPTQGTRQSVNLEQTGGPLGGNGNYQKLFTQAEWWVPTGRLGSGPRASQMALGLSGRAGAIFGDVGLFPFERFYVGGVMFGQPLRGYQESSIGPRGYNVQCNRNLNLSCLGDAFFTISGEYAIRLTDALSVSAFGDAGNVYASVGQFNTAQLFRSTGVGVTLVTPFLGAIGIDAAYGFDRPDPGWEIHFKLGNQ